MNGKKAKQLHKVATSLHKGEGQVYKDYEYINKNYAYLVILVATRQLVPCVRKTYRFLKRDYVRKQINLRVKI